MLPNICAISTRRMAVGAELDASGTEIHFRVWAPTSKTVHVIFEDWGEPEPLEREEEGYFAGAVHNRGAGTIYKLQMDGGEAYPDPASRFQPAGPHGCSQVVDPGAF